MNSQNDQNGTSLQKTSSKNERFNQVLIILTKLSKVQKNYGKTPAELEDYVDGFMTFIPEEIPTRRVLEAIVKYAHIRGDMPVPAEILNIISHGYPETKDGRHVAPTQTNIMDDFGDKS